MRCIYCQKKTTFVIDSRENHLGIRRRRHCSACKSLFTTTETALSENLFVLKKNGRRQRFRRDKLFVSVFTTVLEGKYRDNGASSAKATIITDEVCRQLLNEHTRTVSSALIAQLSYSELFKASPFLAQKYRLYSSYRVDTIVAEG